MSVEQVQTKLVKEHLVAFLIATVVLGVLLLDAVVGQVAGHVLEVGAVVRLRGGPQHALPIQIDVVMVVHKDPAPGNTISSTVSVECCRLSLRASQKHERRA